MTVSRDHVDAIVAQWRRERPDLDVRPLGSFGRVLRLAQLADAELGRMLAEHGLQPGWFDVLAALRRAGTPYELTPTQLLDAMIVTSGGLTKRLDRMADAGLRHPAPRPGRPARHAGPPDPQGAYDHRPGARRPRPQRGDAAGRADGHRAAVDGRPAAPAARRPRGPGPVTRSPPRPAPCRLTACPRHRPCRTLQDLRTRLGDVELWTPYVDEVLSRHGLLDGAARRRGGVPPDVPDVRARRRRREAVRLRRAAVERRVRRRARRARAGRQRSRAARPDAARDRPAQA